MTASAIIFAVSFRRRIRRSFEQLARWPERSRPGSRRRHSLRKAVEREARQARLVRHAAVLGEKEYCVLIDPDGKREIKVGPARVFPGPYDTFMIKGSRNRVYDAYELLPQRALWLRVISAISRTDMAAKMPRGVQLDKEMYYPGDELLLTGVSGFFFPFNEIEVLSPGTGEAVVGNDHRAVFIEAIGIDQKSGNHPCAWEFRWFSPACGRPARAWPVPLLVPVELLPAITGPSRDQGARRTFEVARG